MATGPEHCLGRRGLLSFYVDQLVGGRFNGLVTPVIVSGRPDKAKPFTHSVNALHEKLACFGMVQFVVTFLTVHLSNLWLWRAIHPFLISGICNRKTQPVDQL